MWKQLRIRYSLKSLLIAWGSIALLLGWYVARLRGQDAAIAVIEDNGGMVGHFNEWLVIGVDEKTVIPTEYVTRTASLFNRDVLTIRIANDFISDDICDAFDSLPTVEFIEITGGCSQSELQNLQQRFPEVEVVDMETVIAEIIGCSRSGNSDIAVSANAIQFNSDGSDWVLSSPTEDPK